MSNLTSDKKIMREIKPNKKKKSANEYFPNENIFTDDAIHYKLKQDLSFELPLEDDNCSCDYINMKINSIKLNIILLLIRSTLNLLWNFNTYSYFFSFLNH